MAMDQFNTAFRNKIDGLSCGLPVSPFSLKAYSSILGLVLCFEHILYVFQTLENP